MIEKCMEIIPQYDLVVKNTFRGRGSVIFDTNEGYKKMYEYTGTKGKLQYEYELANYLKDQGFENVDGIVKTKEDELFVCDEYETQYVLKDWFVGKDCNVKSEHDVKCGIMSLATLHKITESVPKLNEIATVLESPYEECERHNIELKRVKNYIRGKKHKVEFEYDILKHFEEYYNCAVEATALLKNTSISRMLEVANEKTTICHGNYNYHNIIFIGEKTAVTGFERGGIGLPVKDLYFYLRKVMEKHDWDLKLGYDLLENYNKIRTISKDETETLKVLLMYPEKFWKVLNQYFNGNKAWIPDKNVDKLKKVYGAQAKKEEFIKKMWSE